MLPYTSTSVENFLFLQLLYIPFHLLKQGSKVFGVGFPNKQRACYIIAMYKHIAHIDDIAPWGFRVLFSEFFGQHIGRFTDNHDIVNHRVKTHLVALHFLKGFAFKEFHHMANARLNMI